MQNFQRALLVEDEESLTTSLTIAMRKLQIAVTSVSTLTEARNQLSESDFDLILLDRMLPDGDGLDLCKELRHSEYMGTILMLTAKGQVDDRIQGLTGGADDYLPKPFNYEELHARIEALSRSRKNAVAMHHLQLPSTGWEVDPARLRIRSPHRSQPEAWVTLTPLEFKLATRLMNAQGEIVGREELLKDVWGFTLIPKTRTVDHFLGRLRKYFEENADDPKHFLTVRGAGYRFEA